MAVEYPDNPQVNDTITDNGVIYKWDGVKWKSVHDDTVLGSAAYAETIDFATALQGSKADTALQPQADLADLGSGSATSGQILTADGFGGIQWKDDPSIAFAIALG